MSLGERGAGEGVYCILRPPAERIGAQGASNWAGSSSAETAGTAVAAIRVRCCRQNLKISGRPLSAGVAARCSNQNRLGAVQLPRTGHSQDRPAISSPQVFLLALFCRALPSHDAAAAARQLRFCRCSPPKFSNSSSSHLRRPSHQRFTSSPTSQSHTFYHNQPTNL